MKIWLSCVAFPVLAIVLPFLVGGIVKKTRAIFQNRVGPPLAQPFRNFVKLLRKKEVISTDASWLFRGAPIIMSSSMVALALLVPWLPFAPDFPGQDLFLVAYMFAVARFFMILCALDTGSPFGAFGASREAMIALLTEPATVLSLVALAVSASTADLHHIFAYGSASGGVNASVWVLAGCGLFIASLIELSRMPVDDPSTHLELTMVHEAMIIECSGPNLALAELAYSMRMMILFGLVSQCFIHAFVQMVPMSVIWVNVMSVVAIPLVGIAVAFVEAFAVKLRWQKVPEFVAFSLSMALLACLAAMVKGVGL